MRSQPLSLAHVRVSARWRIGLGFVAGLAILLSSCENNTTDPSENTDLTFLATPTFSPTNPGVGDSITLTCQVINRGVQTSSASSACAFSVNRDGVDRFVTGTMPGVAASGSMSFLISFTENVAGAHTYTVILNSDQQVSEVSFANNSSAVLINVGSQVDLTVIGTPTVSPAPLTVTTAPITLTIGITNNSATDTASGVHWRISRDGVDGYLSGTLPTLTPGANINYQVLAPADPVSGGHHYVFTIDPDLLIQDPNRSNNSTDIAVFIDASG